MSPSTETEPPTTNDTPTSTINNNNNYYDDENDDDNDNNDDVKNERRRTNLIRNRGTENGLFRACMDAIREQHHMGQMLRTAFVMGGVFTDVKCYTELLCQFYVCTKALEETLLTYRDSDNGNDNGNDEINFPIDFDRDSYAPLSSSISSSSSISMEYQYNKQQQQLQSEAAIKIPYYHFTKGYEKDLKYLLFGDEHFSDPTKFHHEIQRLTTQESYKYIQMIQHKHPHKHKHHGDDDHHHDDKLKTIAAMIILWGPMIIGGGASLYRRVKKAYGERACHVFEPIMLDIQDKHEREIRRNWFIHVVDAIAVNQSFSNEHTHTHKHTHKNKQKNDFDVIVDYCGQFMRANNAIMISVKRRPWWAKYVYAGVVGTLAIGLATWSKGWSVSVYSYSQKHN